VDKRILLGYLFNVKPLTCWVFQKRQFKGGGSISKNNWLWISCLEVLSGFFGIFPTAVERLF
jgi:hypothetical protein